jgi:crotonobetainyl-CoA:carnitine CoA-transferase CaiB-like acyl-CoA transferase
VLTHAWIGTYGTELLGLLSCDVIQVETRKRLDSWRVGYDAVMPPELRDLPSAEHAWNCSPRFNSVNLNKRGITLDLAYGEGRELFEQLVADADIVVENFSRRVIGQRGVDYESLRRIQPDLIMLSMSGYGGSGPWRDTLGIGGTSEPTSGMSSLLGYRNSQPFNSGQMFPDPVGGLHGFAALMTALYHRERTSQGQYIDLSMQESCATYIGDALLEYLWTRNIRPRLGNRHLIFAATSDQRWVALTAESEQQWRALANVARHPEWLQDHRFASNKARKQHEDELEAAIAAWVATEDRDALVAHLLSAGLPAAPVLDGLELCDDPVYRERGVVEEVDHIEAGRWAQVRVPYHFSRTPARVASPAPALGQHSREVVCDKLGLLSAAHATPEQLGITGQGPPP